jgi:tRNA threonylcarbamoyladenosine biosynthesis protein TsaB
VLILALDTTTRGGSAAVLRDADARAVVAGDPARTHGERLPAELDRALRDAGLARRDVDLLAVASGPGAFTGLRIGLAAMQGLALALNRPVLGVSALDALATAAAAERDQASLIACWMDAHRGEVFGQLFERRDDRIEAIGPPIVGAPRDVLLSWRPRLRPGRTVFAGDGAVRCADLLAGDAAAVEAPPALAPWIGRLAFARAAKGETGSPHALQPLYVRRPDAEIARDRRSEP